MLALRSTRAPGFARALPPPYLAPALAGRRGSPSLQLVIRPAGHLVLQPLRSQLAIRRRNYATASKPSGKIESEKAVAEKKGEDVVEKKEVGKPADSRLARAWETVKKEASHYWHGTKLLGKEIRISTRLLAKLVRGGKLTRREHRQLKRTTTDLLRLIPFIPFVIIPFMEFLLPVALKIFPNMLPSTFEDKYKEEEKKRKLLKVRLEMAKFLQETLREGGLSNPEKIKQSEEFKEFFRKVRSTGEKPSTDDIVNVAKLFEDDLTLDNLSRPQLVSMCRYLNINAFGTDNFLRYTIRQRMKHLKEDDQVIDSEGTENLSLAELHQICQSRAIRTADVSEERLRKELDQWLDLHLHRGLSGTLLVLSRAFAFDKTNAAGGKDDSHLLSLKDTLASLPDTLLNEAEMEVSDAETSYKRKLEVLEEQEELIEDEAEQEEREEASRKAKKEAEEKLKAESAERVQQEKEKAKAESMLPPDQAEAVEPDADVRMTSEQLAELGQALSILSARSNVVKEREDLRKLMEDFKETEEESGETQSGLAKRIKSMIKKVDQQIEEFDSQVDTMRRERINLAEDGKIAIHDLRRALEVIRHRPSDESIQVLCDKLDVDRDGFVPLDHVVSLANEEGLGIVIDDETPGANLIGKTQQLRKERDARPKKEDLVED